MLEGSTLLLLSLILLNRIFTAISKKAKTDITVVYLFANIFEKQGFNALENIFLFKFVLFFNVNATIYVLGNVMML